MKEKIWFKLAEYLVPDKIVGYYISYYHGLFQVGIDYIDFESLKSLLDELSKHLETQSPMLQAQEMIYDALVSARPEDCSVYILFESVYGGENGVVVDKDLGTIREAVEDKLENFLAKAQAAEEQEQIYEQN